MSYKLSFYPNALAEWKKLDAPVREIFKKKLAERLQNSRIPAARLSGHKDRFKIKLREAGHSLVYEMRNGALMVVVVAIGKRERNAVYKAPQNANQLRWDGWSEAQPIKIQTRHNQAGQS